MPVHMPAPVPKTGIPDLHALRCWLADPSICKADSCLTPAHRACLPAPAFACALWSCQQLRTDQRSPVLVAILLCSPCHIE